ncbi:MAG TPA: isoprenylcysteine carboxylmethyltransferase family protein [Syntrophobacteraceae bacterium]|nr:isoprenylcysteine carboxylmethyltransferase family protein [Syntrophobacteraceae bacterium]
MTPKTPLSAPAGLIDRISSSRTAVTRKFAFLLAALLLIIDHSWPRSGFLVIFLETTGLLLVGIGAMGRAWASMYISGYKDRDLITEGAYSIVRNPLYVFSFLGAIGIGCATGSLLLIGLLILGFFIYYPLTMADEEKKLATQYGEQYTDYAGRTPRFVPNFSLFHERETYTVHSRTYRYAFLDAVWFVWIYGLIQLIGKLHETGTLPTLLRIP